MTTDFVCAVVTTIGLIAGAVFELRRSGDASAKLADLEHRLALAESRLAMIESAMDRLRRNL